MKLRVLVVDDHQAILEHVAKWLETTGQATVVATTSEQNQVYELWDTHTPDLLLCDVHMPNIDGYEVCRQLKQRDPKSKILLFCAAPTLSIRAAAITAGALGVLSKTEDLATLIRTLSETIF